MGVLGHYADGAVTDAADAPDGVGDVLHAEGFGGLDDDESLGVPDESFDSHAGVALQPAAWGVGVTVIY
jgi:hypothetical protein